MKTLLLPLLLAVAGFTLKDQSGQYLDVIRDGKIVARYMYAYDPSSKDSLHATYKPYLHVFDPEGVAPITKGPGGEYTHHRGIFIGYNKLTVGGKVFDRWHMKGGEQVHTKFLALDDGNGFTSLVEWRAAEPKILLEEERAFRFLPPTSPAYAVIEMTSKLKAVAGPTVLGGDPEHAGLQFRPAQEIDRAATEYVYPKENADPHKDKDYPWVGETFMLQGRRYSVIYLNHPSNPRNTATSAYRDYGRFGMFFKDTIPAGEERVLRVRFLLVAGAMPSADVIQKAYNEFAGTSDPVPKITVKKAEGTKAPARSSAQPKTK